MKRNTRYSSDRLAREKLEFRKWVWIVLARLPVLLAVLATRHSDNELRGGIRVQRDRSSQ